MTSFLSLVSSLAAAFDLCQPYTSITKMTYEYLMCLSELVTSQRQTHFVLIITLRDNSLHLLCLHFSGFP